MLGAFNLRESCLGTSNLLRLDCREITSGSFMRDIWLIYVASSLISLFCDIDNFLTAGLKFEKILMLSSLFVSSYFDKDFFG